MKLLFSFLAGVGAWYCTFWLVMYYSLPAWICNPLALLAGVVIFFWVLAVED